MIGMSLIAAVVGSCCRVALVNARTGDWLTGGLARGLYGAMGEILRRQRDYPARQKILAWFAPCFLLACIACYFVVTAAGFGLIYWAVGAEETLFRAMIASGSALSTLGFCTPSTPRGEVIAVFEGAVGLGIVVFLITFVPGYQNAIQRREEISAELYAHTGGKPTCTAVLRAYFGQNALPAPLRDWEYFLRELGDIHAASPILILTPSVRSGQTWVVSVFAMLEAANFTAAVRDDPVGEAARICLLEGGLSLQRMAAALHAESKNLRDIPFSRSEFDALWEPAEHAAHPAAKERERAWAEFTAARAQYAPYCRILATRLFVRTNDLRAGKTPD